MSRDELGIYYNMTYVKLNEQTFGQATHFKQVMTLMTEVLRPTYKSSHALFRLATETSL